MRAGGTWLGITQKGRFAAVTNYRDHIPAKKDARSRGSLVSGFLMGEEDPATYLNRLVRDRDQYNGFNLIAGTPDRLFWYSNRGPGPQLLGPGIYGLSNRLLDNPWPKVTRAKEALTRILSDPSVLSIEALFELLRNQDLAHDRELPDTGVGLEWERILSPIFITSPTYGTRSSTVILSDSEGYVTFIERIFDSSPEHTSSAEYRFRVEQWEYPGPPKPPRAPDNVL
jgi:uncharacterized protein with NRDE domain